MENKKVMNLTFASSLTELCEVNSSFDSAILRVAYKNLNRNHSFISKETFERCAGTMYNCPVVCNYDRDTDSLGGHDTEVFKDSNDGSIRIVNVTTPVGVIPTQAKYWWDTVTEDDGTEHEYLFTEVLIWKRQEAYKKIKRDNIVAHSMEISVKDGEVKDGIYYIYDFEFTAFCLIGSEPCFESSALLFSLDGFQSKISEMMHDFKELLTEVSTSNDVDNTHPQKYSMEGGNEVLKDKMELAAKYGIDISTLDFSVEDMTIEELTEKFEAMKAESEVNIDDSVDTDNTEEFANNEVDEDNSDESEDFSLVSGVIEELHRALSDFKVQREWGDAPKYLYVDADLANNEVYCWDTNDWLLYGFAYSINGDAVSIDEGTKKRKKFAITDFEGESVDDGGSQLFDLVKSMENMIVGNIGLEAKYNTASDMIEQMKTELTELREFKKEVEDTAEEIRREDLFGMFEDLTGLEAFESLREDNSSYDYDTLEEKLYALRGRNGVQVNFNLNNKAPKIKVTKTHEPKEPYGGVVEKYLGSND